MNMKILRVWPKLAIVTGLSVVLLAGCQSGSLSNSRQSCKSSGGLFSDKKVSCTGSVDTARGQPGLSIADTDGDLSGQYRLNVSMKLEKGTIKARIASASGGQKGGEVSVGKPLQIDTRISLSEDDEEVTANLNVSGKKASDLSYRTMLIPQN